MGWILLSVAAVTAVPLAKAIRNQRPYWLFRADSIWPDVFGVAWLAAVVVGASRALSTILN
jgi:hypothetical protein